MNRTLNKLGVVFLAAVLLAAVANPALANNWGGRKTGANQDGSFVSVSPIQFSPGTSNCVLFSAVGQDAASIRLIQAGAVRCNQTGLDNASCNSVKFTETINGSNVATCTAHGSFSVNVYHDYKVLRTSAGGGTWQASIDGNGYETVSGMSQSVQAVAWAERAPGYDCGAWSASSNFQNFQKYVYGQGWTQTAGAAFTVGQDGNGNTQPGCWAVSGVNGSGVFSVQH